MLEWQIRSYLRDWHPPLSILTMPGEGGSIFLQLFGKKKVKRLYSMDGSEKRSNSFVQQIFFPNRIVRRYLSFEERKKEIAFTNVGHLA